MSINAAFVDTKEDLTVSRDVLINAIQRPNPVLNMRYEMAR